MTPPEAMVSTHALDQLGGCGAGKAEVNRTQGDYDSDSGLRNPPKGVLRTSTDRCFDASSGFEFGASRVPKKTRIVEVSY
jgi:hypothetical protein